MIKTTTFFLISTCSNILCLRQCSHLFSYVSWLWIDDKSEHTDFVLIPASQWIRISLCIWQSHAIISLKVHSPIYFPVPICKNDGNISSWVPPYDLFRQLPFYRTFPYGSSSIFWCFTCIVHLHSQKSGFHHFLTHWNRWYSVYLSSHYRFDKRTVSKYILKRRTAWNSVNLVGISRWFYGFLCLYSNSTSMKAFFHSAFMIQNYLAWSMLDMSGTNALARLTVTNPI